VGLLAHEPPALVVAPQYLHFAIFFLLIAPRSLTLHHNETAFHGGITLQVSNILSTSMLYMATVGEILMLVKHFQENNMGMFRELYGKF